MAAATATLAEKTWGLVLGNISTPKAPAGGAWQNVQGKILAIKNSETQPPRCSVCHAAAVLGKHMAAATAVLAEMT